eukprot:1161713-Pelagomonas_calceolata.AAC.1
MQTCPLVPSSLPCSNPFHANESEPHYCCQLGTGTLLLHSPPCSMLPILPSLTPAGLARALPCCEGNAAERLVQGGMLLRECCREAGARGFCSGEGPGGALLSSRTSRAVSIYLELANPMHAETHHPPQPSIFFFCGLPLLNPCLVHACCAAQAPQEEKDGEKPKPAARSRRAAASPAAAKKPVSRSRAPTTKRAAQKEEQQEHEKKAPAARSRKAAALAAPRSRSRAAAPKKETSEKAAAPARKAAATPRKRTAAPAPRSRSRATAAPSRRRGAKKDQEEEKEVEEEHGGKEEPEKKPARARAPARGRQRGKAVAAEEEAAAPSADEGPSEGEQAPTRYRHCLLRDANASDGLWRLQAMDAVLFRSPCKLEVLCGGDGSPCQGWALCCTVDRASKGKGLP